MTKLSKAGVDSPRRDCLVLVEDLLGKDRSWVTAHAESELTKDQSTKLESQLIRRIKREPLAYIRKKAWFYKRFFYVDPNVMIPRPESESFIEILKEIKPSGILDIGTGSGCLAITAKLELPKTKVIASDISEKALKIAAKNAKNHKVEINFKHGSLLENIRMMPETIIANLPYVPDGLVTSPEINYEPKTALFSGKDGLDQYRELWRQIRRGPKKPGYVLVESLDYQHEDMVSLAENSGYRLVKTEILVQLFQLRTV